MEGQELSVQARLTAEDLVPDRALVEGDPDRFRHEAIAARLADLVVAGDTPLDIALFGPWGSGKSSIHELLRRKLPSQAEKVALVRYDAWKFGGASLQRNFISHLANELGFKDSDKNRDFHAGLYQSRRRALVDFENLKEGFWTALGIFALVYTSLLLVFAVLAGLSHFLTDENFLGQVGSSLPRLIAPTAFVGLAVALAKMLLDGTKVDIDQAQPAAEEEFARTFETLVRRARTEKGFERLVVFVDELDRCAPDDVVKTLTAVKTFLGQEHCVFVVAADRAVIERALTELPQATPVDEENPYYSSASSFFDKVFQYRTALPPLRNQRLTGFARDLVVDRGGLWAELRRRDDGRYVEDVIYYLVPSHVRSPRRVKALLNDFALNARIAESRGIAWLERAHEIAKLTVLQTEFPVFASDLHEEPRLPSFLLAPPENPSPRVARLLKRHGRRQASEDHDGHASVPGEERPDPLLVDAGPAQTANIAETESRLLVRYLERAADIPDPGRDLLYLETAGAAVGLDDPELGELVEAEAPEAPERVVEAVADRPPEVRCAVARVLAQMTEQEFGRERANVMSALMGAVTAMGDDVKPVAAFIAPTVRSYQQDRQLAETHLIGALYLALAVPPEGDGALVDALFDDDRLLASSDRVAAVASVLDRLRETHQERVREAIAQYLPEDNAVLTRPLNELHEPAAVELLASPAVTEAVAARLKGEEGVEEFVDALYEAVGDPRRLELESRIQWSLLVSGTAYSTVRARADAVLGSLAPSKPGDSHVLLALRQAPEEDWGFWRAFLSEPDYEWPVQGDRAVAALKNNVSSFRGAADPEEVSALVDALVPFLRLAADELMETLLSDAEAVLQSVPWWQDAAATMSQRQLHQALRRLREVDDNVSTRINEMLVADVVRAPLEPHSVTPEMLNGVRELGVPLGAWAEAVVPRLPAHGTTVAPVATEVALARCALARAARDDGASIGPDSIDPDEVVAAVQTGVPAGYAVFEEWSRLGPAPALVGQIIDALGDATPTRVVQAVEAWARALDEPARTEFVKQLIGRERDISRWVGAVCAHDVDEEELVQHVLGAIKKAGRADRRQELVDALVAIAPQASRAQQGVAHVVEYLLSSGKDVDFKLAQRATPALGTQHRATDRLRRAFRDAAEERGQRVSSRYAEHLARSGIKLPKKSLTDAAVDAVKSVLRL